MAPQVALYSEIALLAALLQQFRHQRRPSRLMVRPDPRAVIAVEILVEQNMILEIRIALKFLAIPRTPAGCPVRIPQENMRKPPRQLCATSLKFMRCPEPRGKLHLQIVAEIIMEPLQDFRSAGNSAETTPVRASSNFRRTNPCVDSAGS